MMCDSGKLPICDRAHTLLSEDATTTVVPKPLEARVRVGYKTLPAMDDAQWDWSKSMTAHAELYRGGSRPDVSLPVPF